MPSSICCSHNVLELSVVSHNVLVLVLAQHNNRCCFLSFLFPIFNIFFYLFFFIHQNRQGNILVHYWYNIYLSSTLSLRDCSFYTCCQLLLHCLTCCSVDRFESTFLMINCSLGQILIDTYSYINLGWSG